ncbi:hypothetical protein FACS1894177_06190 [Bacteroidia bacterium]|nr:hypothetical protein FACS1894177_06190 [Bacteroidia bacterium]
MCYTLSPFYLFAYFMTATKRNEISYKELRNIRERVEEEDFNIYVEITRGPILEAVKNFPKIMEMEDTKIVFYRNSHETKQKKEDLKDYVDAIPKELKNILDKVVLNK